MKDEIKAAVDFLSRLVLAKNESIPESKLEEFRETLNIVLNQRFKNHWFPRPAIKGSGIQVYQGQWEHTQRYTSRRCLYNYRY